MREGWVGRKRVGCGTMQVLGSEFSTIIFIPHGHPKHRMVTFSLFLYYTIHICIFSPSLPPSLPSFLSPLFVVILTSICTESL